MCVFAGYNLYSIFHEYKAGSDEYAKIQDMVVVEQDARQEEAPKEVKKTEKKTWKAPISVDSKKLKELNKDYVGWLYIEALPEISYPVVHGEDNEYYLHHTFEKQDNFAGTLFVDCDNEGDLGDPNTIIYGHNMKNGTMFGQLKEFKLPEILEKSKYIWMLTPDENIKYEIFSGYTAKINSETYTLIKGPGKELQEYGKNMSILDQLGLGTREFDVKDNIITLSTCTGNDTTRYVIQAVRVDP